MENRDHEVLLDDLRGRQSVRATFRLPQQVIDLLSVIATQLGIKQKSLFDQLVENPTVLKKISDEAGNYPSPAGDRVQKTYVISRSTLTALDRVARNRNIPRDILVEISINRLLPIIETELEKHRNRKVLLEEMQNHLDQGRKLLKQTRNLLGSADPLYEMIANQVRISEKNVSIIRDMVEKGKPMENW